jgi:dTDP-L-rhamnose 4-epimerase
MRVLITGGAGFNSGSGTSLAVLSIAADVAWVVGKSAITPRVTGKYRAGDIRHRFADLAPARRKRGYIPQVDFRQGPAEFAAWLEDQVADDRVDRATAELESRGLVA